MYLVQTSNFRVKMKNQENNKPLILIVDDEDFFLKIISHNLEPLFNILIAYNGKEALNSVHKHSPHLILMDAVMPVIDGIQACKMLKSASCEKIRETPVVIVTALDDEDSVDRAFGAGADDYITKPINVHVLRRRIQHILKRRKAEDELVELNRSLEVKVNTEIKKRLDQETVLIQQSKMAAMGEMIAAIAHQWRQPLNALGVTIQNIKDAYRFKEVDEKFIDRVVSDSFHQIKFMSDTIDNFRNFFQHTKEKTAFDTCKAIKEVNSIMSAQLAFHGIKVKVDTNTTDNLTFKGYLNEFMQVLLNIITNAMDAILEARKKGRLGKKEGDIVISNYRKDKRIVIEVNDNGGGIDEKILERIFEPYFTTKKHKGTGIGLYMSKIIIENNMKGKLYAKNTGQGARLIIELEENGSTEGRYRGVKRI